MLHTPLVSYGDENFAEKTFRMDLPTISLVLLQDRFNSLAIAHRTSRDSQKNVEFVMTIKPLMFYPVSFKAHYFILSLNVVMMIIRTVKVAMKTMMIVMMIKAVILRFKKEMVMKFIMIVTTILIMILRMIAAINNDDAWW